MGLRVAILGLGLIGGSAGLAWRAAGHTVVGYARRPATGRRALEMGAADEAVATLAQATDADVVVLALPVLAIRQLMRDLSPLLRPGTVVTDVASTKRHVERWARQLLPPHAPFVGGHPMAGKETAGIEHADGSLFRGRTWCIVPPEGADAAAVERVTRLAREAGARPLQIGAADHDRAVAVTSHLSFMTSVTLCQAVVAREDFRRVAPVAGTGLRDTTRLASGDPLMHRDICLTNRDFLVHELETFGARVAEVTDLIRRLPDPEAAPGDPAVDRLERLFAELKTARDAWLEGRLLEQRPE